jgi:hypothetical protein
MGSVLHGIAATTPRIRKEMQDAQESLATLAKRYRINEKTVLHWKHADGVDDNKSDPKVRKSVLNELVKYVYVELHQRMTAGNAVDFLRNLQAECVFKITHILTDNGAQFTCKLLPEKSRPATEHPFD